MFINCIVFLMMKKKKKNSAEEIFNKGVSSIGPFNSSISPLFIFSSHYKGEQINLYTDMIIKEAIKREYIEALYNMSGVIYSIDSVEPDNKLTKKYIMQNYLML